MSISHLISTLFATDSLQFWWYLTRAAGLMGYFLVWLSTAWGLLVSSKILDPILQRASTYDFHEWLSLLGLVFIFVHVTVLIADRYLPYSFWQILIPFLSPYRPLWVGVGVLSLYLTILVTVTFYLRRHIGMGAFRKIHYFSLLAYLGSTLHGLYAGTDSALPVTTLLYAGTMLLTVFLIVYWVMRLQLRKQEEQVLIKKKRHHALRQGKSGQTRAAG